MQWMEEMGYKHAWKKSTNFTGEPHYSGVSDLYERHLCDRATKYKYF